MKKAISNAKNRAPSKLLRRVLSKTSATSNTSSRSKDSEKEFDTMKIDLESEINSLKHQITKLQLVVNGMQNDAEKKDEDITNLAREKDKLTFDLHKEKRSNKKLKQQLDDERDFYYREKESYCKEMNEYKKLKKKYQKTKREEEMEKDLAKCNTEMHKLKDTLHKTLEANYNLCVKFLRMKNTKYCLKSRLKKMQSSYDKLKLDYQTKIDLLKNEMSGLINNHFTLAIHPSNKKYLQLVKHNGMLIHENMCLQLEVDRLVLELERLKMMQIRKETDSKLKYINSKTRTEFCVPSTTKSLEEPTASNTKRKDRQKPKENAVDAELDKEDQNKIEEKSKIVKHSRSSVKFVEQSNDEAVTKIFERKETSGVPTISLLNEENLNSSIAEKSKTPPQTVLNSSKITMESNHNYKVCEVKDVAPSTSGLSVKVPSLVARLEVSEISMKTFFGSTIADGSRSDLSECSYYPASEATRTQSAPEIVQSSCFVNQT